jgi:hypothetical protein
VESAKLIGAVVGEPNIGSEEELAAGAVLTREEHPPCWEGPAVLMGKKAMNSSGVSVGLSLVVVVRLEVGAPSGRCPE